MHGLGTTALIEKLKAEKNIDWEDQPNAFKYGSMVKKEIYEKEAVDHKTGEKVIAKRTRLVTKSFKLSGFNEENINLIFKKYWNSDEEKVEKEEVVKEEVQKEQVESSAQ